MAYVKKKFEDTKYYKMYDIINNNRRNIPKIAVLPNIENITSSLDWEGESKEDLQEEINDINDSFLKIKREIEKNIIKVNKCNGSLYIEIEKLKNKINEYNGYVDEREAILAAIAAGGRS